jgi:hypothetical protein
VMVASCASVMVSSSSPVVALSRWTMPSELAARMSLGPKASCW